MENSSESKERERLSKKLDNYCKENGDELFISSGYFAHEDIIDLILQEKQASYQQGVIDAVENIYKKIDYKKCVSYNEPWINLKIVKEICVELKQSAEKELG